MGLLDYAFLIKNPMDLGTVDMKLKDDRYEIVEEVLDDIQLVWDNCKTYNSQNTVIINIFVVDSWSGIKVREVI